MAEMQFHELHGEYVANAGQTISLREYLDYFEPLGSALARMPDGAGGPFVHQFTDSGGRTIGSIGWVVSAASKRFGAWKLWGMWTDRAIPAVALPLFWPELSDPSRTADLVSRANEDAERLFDRRRWPDLLHEVKTLRLRDDALRGSLETVLERAWSVPPPHRHSIEVELTPQMLDVLPWVYILGPVDPIAAQLQPARFNGAGYQYILDEHQEPPRVRAASAVDVGALVDTAASDVVKGWRMANDLRARRERPKRAERMPPPRVEPLETMDMPTKPTPKPPIPWQPIYQIAVIAILAWIAYNVNVIRKATTAQRDGAPPAVSTTAPVDTTEPAPAPVPENPTGTLIPRIAAALAASPPRNIRVSETVLNEIEQGGAGAEERLARVAIEVFLRRNACHSRAEIVDGRFSTAEQRSIRNCAAIQDNGLVRSNFEPDNPRAIAWLQRLVRVD